MAKDSEQTRQRLFTATMELLGEKGFGSTTVDEIVERAGVAKGTVYYHFKSKAELVEALMKEQPLGSNLTAAVASSSDPAEQMAAIVRAELEFIRDNRDFARLFITEMWREDRKWRETLLILRNGVFATISDTIRRGMDAGVFAADLDPGLSASAIFGSVATVALDWLMLDPERDIEEVASRITDLVAKSLAA